MCSLTKKNKTKFVWKICTLRNQTPWINDTWGKQTKQAEKLSMRWGGHSAPMNDSEQRGIYEEAQQCGCRPRI